MFLKSRLFAVLVLEVTVLCALDITKIIVEPVCDKNEDSMRVNLSDWPHCPLAQKEGFRIYCMNSKYRENAQKYLEFHVRPDDVWILAYPRSGTTWTQYMVEMILGGTIKLKSKLKSYFFSWPTNDKSIDSYLEDFEKLPSPRIFHAHLPAPLLPRQIWTVKPKIIYVARNVKDATVSRFHFNIILGFNGTLSDFCDVFMHDCLLYTPYDIHVTDMWGLRHEDNVRFVTYESMKKDLPAVIRNTAEFLGKSLNEEQIGILAERLSFTNMAKDFLLWKKLALQFGNREFNFLRKGNVGTYREEMSSELIEKFDAWIRQRLSGHKDYEKLLDIFMGYGNEDYF